MFEFVAVLNDWPYLIWAFGAASVFYAVTAFAIGHLHPDKKAHLSLWLQGDYASTWSEQFCTMFDSVFGSRHLRLRCILLSAAASVIAVLAIWLLLDQILGLISLRAETGLDLSEALLLGAVINIVPDYLSLYETRWLLKQFARIRNPVGQLFVLMLDAVVTGLIIYGGISLYLLANGKPGISVVEMMALFSFYAVFFYSTFLTSIWAWIYCLSFWIARISAMLKNWIDVQNSPGSTLALIGSVIVLVGAITLKPIITMDEEGRISFDSFLCDSFPASVCTHLARLSKDQRLKLEFLSAACIGGVTSECLDAGYKLRDIKPEEAAKLWEKSCIGGMPEGCNALGAMYLKGLGIRQDETRAVNLFQQACDGGVTRGCLNVGWAYANGVALKQDYSRAINLYKQGCDGGDPLGCSDLGTIYENGLGVAKDDARAVNLYRQACDGGETTGCVRLGIMYANGRGVDRDDARAVDLYREGCDGENELGCTRLGLMYMNGRGVDENAEQAVGLFRQGCDRGDPKGCTSLALMYVDGYGVRADSSRAASLYLKGCDGGDVMGCTNLGLMYMNGDGVDQNAERAGNLFQQGCDGRDPKGCTNLAFMYHYGIGVEADRTMVVSLYRKACEMGDEDICDWLSENPE